MLYLAQVVKRNFRSRTSLKLLALQQADQLWLVVDNQVIDVDDAALGDRDLVLVEISVNRKVLKTLDVSVELPTILDTLSKRALWAEMRSKDQEDEWQLRKKSLQVQSQELSERQEVLDAREEQLKLNEVQVTESLTKAREWEIRLQQVRVKLRSEWEQLAKRKEGKA